MAESASNLLIYEIMYPWLRQNGCLFAEFSARRQGCFQIGEAAGHFSTHV